MDPEALLDSARRARANAYAPFSGFAVGAALLAEDGRIFAGCNVENRSFGLTLCAERTAIAAAVAAGVRRFVAVAVVTDTDPPAAPCGLCRESLAEFCGDDLRIYLEGCHGRRRETTLGALFPDRFDFPAPSGSQ